MYSVPVGIHGLVTFVIPSADKMPQSDNEEVHDGTHRWGTVTGWRFTYLMVRGAIVMRAHSSVLLRRDFMKKTLMFVLSLLLCFGLSADEIFIPIAGSVGVFSTDMRLVNPSPDTDLTIQATYLPRNNVDNSAATPVEVSIPPREMAVFDDVVSSLFQAGDLGAIRLVSESSFNATARIFAQETAGTLGQFIVGVPIEGALEKGILLQLGSSDEFRTNVGLVNPDPNSPAAVELFLYDAANTVVATATLTLQPWGVIAPTNVAALFPSATGDLSDAWISFVADKPVMVYGSVIDNRTTDPTYVPAVIDTGSAPPAEQTIRTFDVTAFQWDYTFSENGKEIDAPAVALNTHVVLRLTSSDVVHGFQMSPFVPSKNVEPGKITVVEFDADQEGDFTFFCTNFCGDGHPTMDGSFRIGKGGTPGSPDYVTISSGCSSEGSAHSTSHNHHE